MRAVRTHLEILYVEACGVRSVQADILEHESKKEGDRWQVKRTKRA